jgi:hypothetical protein
MTTDSHSDIASRTHDTSHRERSCWRAICVSLAQQLAFLFASAFIQDGGVTLHHALDAALVAWILTAIVVCHQATHRAYIPSDVHLAIVRHSFWVFFVALIIIGHYLTALS